MHDDYSINKHSELVLAHNFGHPMRKDRASCPEPCKTSYSYIHPHHVQFSVYMASNKQLPRASKSASGANRNIEQFGRTEDVMIELPTRKIRTRKNRNRNRDT